MEELLPETCGELRANKLTSAATTVQYRFSQPFDSWPREQEFRRRAFLESIQGHQFTRDQLYDFIVLAYHEMFNSADKLANIWKRKK